MSRFPNHLSPNITPTKVGSAFMKSKSRARREPSGVFSLFQPVQIQQFKEAFQLIDHDKDGWISESDLREIYNHLGQPLSRETLDDLLKSRPGTQPKTDIFGGSGSKDRGINFTMFLTMMSERLFQFDTEADLLEAFESFDENDSGMVPVEELQKWIPQVEDDIDIQKVLGSHIVNINNKQYLKYREWIKVFKVNGEDEDGKQESY